MPQQVVERDQVVAGRARRGERERQCGDHTGDGAPQHVAPRRTIGGTDHAEDHDEQGDRQAGRAREQEPEGGGGRERPLARRSPRAGEAREDRREHERAQRVRLHQREVVDADGERDAQERDGEPGEVPGFTPGDASDQRDRTDGEHHRREPPEEHACLHGLQQSVHVRAQGHLGEREVLVGELPAPREASTVEVPALVGVESSPEHEDEREHRERADEHPRRDHGHRHAPGRARARVPVRRDRVGCRRHGRAQLPSAAGTS